MKKTKKKIIKKKPSITKKNQKVKTSKKKSSNKTTTKNKNKTSNLKKKSIKTTKKTIKKNIKNTKSQSSLLNKDALKKVKKPKLSFEDKLKEILEKLILKNKADGIYTLKLIEKAIPKKFRIPENVKKLEKLITSNNIKIYTDEEAKELANQAKEDSSKVDESNDDEEKKQTGKTDDPV